MIRPDPKNSGNSMGDAGDRDGWPGRDLGGGNVGMVFLSRSLGDDHHRFFTFFFSNVI